MGRILCKVTRKSPCLTAPYPLPPGGQPDASLILRIPSREWTIVSPATRLRPGSGQAERSSQLIPGAGSPRLLGAEPWRGPEPGSGASSSCRVCPRLLCTRCLGKCSELGEARGWVLSLFCLVVNVRNHHHTLVCFRREGVGFETPLLGNSQQGC